MKKYKDLYTQIYDFGNLHQAWKQARRGKRYRPTAAAFERNLDSELATLYDELRTEIYQPGPYRSFTIHEPKRRKISAAPFRDRVAHHALCNVLTPIFERKFIDDSYANRIGKGSHRALDRCTEFMRRYAYVLPCDIQQFFPAIDHAILKGILAHSLADGATLRLCDKIIDSGAGILTEQYDMHYFPGDDLLAAARQRGLPIGNLTSQFWANVYLNPLDHFIKRELGCRAYIRYVDDFLLFASDKQTLHRWLGDVIRFLQTLRLTLHENRAQPRPTWQGIPFLGFTIYPDHRRLKRSKGIHYRRHIYRLYQQYRRGEIGREKLDTSVRAWVGHVMHGDTWGLRTQLFAEMVL
jgi:retron-type reverse transcriptase